LEAVWQVQAVRFPGICVGWEIFRAFFSFLL